MAKYLKLVGTNVYNCPQITGEAISKGTVLRVTNPKFVAHLLSLSKPLTSEVSRPFFEDVSDDPKYVAHEAKLQERSAPVAAPIAASVDEDDTETDNSVKAKRATTTRQRAPRKGKQE